MNYTTKMKSLNAILLLCIYSLTAFAQTNSSPNKYNVIWDSPSENSWGTMPIGNGDIGSNVWVTPDGVLHYYISKTDAYSENGRLLKIGKASVRFTPNILDDKSFKQELDLNSGTIKISTDNVELRIRVDANNPLIHIEGESDQPVMVEADYEGWRKSSRVITGAEMHSARGIMGTSEAIIVEPDTLLKHTNAILWCHHNKRSIWPMVLERQHLGELTKTLEDPLLYRTFGAMIYGENLISSSPNRLVSEKADKRISIKTVVSTSLNTSVKQWSSELSSIQKQIEKTDQLARIKKHKKWWNNFWDRHYIFIESEKEKEAAFIVTQAYILQRYMNACAGRGKLPIKFNGSIFNVDVPTDYTVQRENIKGVDADFRQWGGCYWFQNTRLPYHTMLHAGDFELMRPLFKMYRDALDLARFRTEKYHQHKGAYFPETMYFFGAYSITDYGWERENLPLGNTKNPYILYYWQSGIELVCMMQDYYLFTRDVAFLEDELSEMSKEILYFYDEHYPKNAEGKTEFTPAHSLETYFSDVLNPLPEIAGLQHLTNRFLSGEIKSSDKELMALCEKIQHSLPEIPIRKDENGNNLISPAQKYNPKTSNFENPELYAVFPYPIYGVGRENLELAKKTFDQRKFKENWGWQQDAIQAALLGETQYAKETVVSGFKSKNKESRFPGFWGPHYDWIPDQDHASVKMRALQNMLIQEVDDEILLFPAWPKEWDVTFKIHASENTIVEGKLKAGIIIDKKVTPEKRNKNIKISYQFQEQKH